MALARYKARAAHLAHRPLLHPGSDDGPPVPVAAFAYEHDGPRRDRPAPSLGEHTHQMGHLTHGSGLVRVQS